MTFFILFTILLKIKKIKIKKFIFCFCFSCVYPYCLSYHRCRRRHHHCHQVHHCRDLLDIHPSYQEYRHRHRHHLRYQGFHRHRGHHGLGVAFPPVQHADSLGDPVLLPLHAVPDRAGQVAGVTPPMVAVEHCRRRGGVGNLLHANSRGRFDPGVGGGDSVFAERALSFQEILGVNGGNPGAAHLLRPARRPHEGAELLP